MTDKRTFVLVHGAFHGGWCWRDVANILRAQGHRVFTPTQTGLGERKHLMSRDITLDTFTDDIANLIEAEELDDVVLVGHSFGANATSGVAERMPARIRHLVYLDSLIIEGGGSPFDALPADVVAARRKGAADSSDGLSIPVPSPDVFGVFDPAQTAWVNRHLTPQPLSVYESKLNIRGAVGNGLPRTYVVCTDPIYTPLESTRQWVRAQQGWGWVELATGHDAMVSAPAETARILVEIANR